MVLSVLALASVLSSALAPPATQRPPNVLLILADDLGSGDLGCYGQKKIRTPNLDRLAKEGLRATNAYAGAPVCAPSRCALLTGRDMRHAAVRDNKAHPPDGEFPLPAAEVTLAESLHDAGYATACIGKWGLGPPGSEGDPLTQGFDRFFGFNGQVHAHDHFPTWLWNDREKVELDGKTYAPDRFAAEARAFMVKQVEKNRDEPFFLFFATTVPHLALQVPEDSLAEYAKSFDETPYDGKRGYEPHPTPRAAYAAMVTRLDRDAGLLLDLLRELGIEDDTIVIFTSDNGATFDAGGSDTSFFRSNGELRGTKGQLYEGGIRAPFLIRWPKHVDAGRVDPMPIAAFDLFPTLATLCGAKSPVETEGADLAKWLTSGDNLPPRALCFEHASGGGWRAVRLGAFKLVVRGEKARAGKVTRELFDLVDDPGEELNLAEREPDVLRKLESTLARRSKALVPDWNFQ